MHHISAAFIFAAVATSGTIAFSTDFSQHQWIAPKATDVRSPCPGLNTRVIMFALFYTFLTDFRAASPTTGFFRATG
jgi:hypothetical protein